MPASQGAAGERIDVHHHMIPPTWGQAQLGVPGGMPFVPEWSPEIALNSMDALGIRKSILSVTAPGVHFGDDAAARRLARDVNDFGADVVAHHPGRFGLFASLPLPDVDGAVTEAVRAMDELHADGVVLMSNIHGRYLGDASFRPLWQVLDERGAVVFIHPTSPVGLPPLEGAEGWVDFPFDTTRTAVHLVINHVLRDFGSIRFILAHAGGALPFIAPRIEAQSGMVPELSTDAVHEDIRRFFVDTALSAEPATLTGVLEFCGEDHVLYGTDLGAAPLPVAQGFTNALDDFLSGRPALSDHINQENAQALIAHSRRKTR